MMDENETDDAAVLAAEYALGLLAPQEAAAFAVMLEEDPDFRAEYVQWAEHLASMTDDIAPVAPSDEMRARILAAIEPTDHPVEMSKGDEDVTFGSRLQSWLRNLGLIPAMAGGLAAAMAVLWLVNISGVMDPAVPFATATLASDDNSLVVQITYSDDGETLQINRTVGAAPQGKALELWLIKDGDAPVSLGVLPEDETATLRVDYALRRSLHGASCAISVEAPGGSATGAPTGEILAIAPIVWET